MQVCVECRARIAPGNGCCPVCGAAGEHTHVPGPPKGKPAAPGGFRPVIPRPVPGLPAERKAVSLLGLDAPELHEDAPDALPADERQAIAADLLQLLEESSQQFGARVRGGNGTGMVAVFGAPRADEHHPQLACYAALIVQRELQRYVEYLRAAYDIRVTPRVVVESAEAILRAQPPAEDVNVILPAAAVHAMRTLMHFTPAGRVYLAEPLRTRVDGLIRLDPRGRFRSAPEGPWRRVYEVQGVSPHRTRFDLARARGLTPFVGREAELAALRRTLTGALNGHGQIVSLAGRPGMGRSRLCHEFAAQCRREGVSVFQARGLPAAQLLPFMLVVQLARTYFDIGPGETPAQARAKIHARLAALGGGMTRDFPLLAEFLQVRDPERPPASGSAPVSWPRLFEVFHRLVLAQGKAEPTVLLFEDIHTIDPGSTAALLQAAQYIARSQCLIVVTHRSDYQPPWEDTFACTRIELAPLEEPDARRLVDALLGADPALDPVKADILCRAHGNPFFAEELVRTMVQRGALAGMPGAYRLVRLPDPEGMPDSIRGVIAARIDALPSLAKRTLQTAAVLVPEFTQDVLAHILGRSVPDVHATLCDLVETGFIVETAYYPHATFAFRHPLTREVAETSHLPAGRRALHLAAAHARVTLQADALDAYAARIAAHYACAGRAGDAARWRARAARHAGRAIPAEALEHWRAVRVLLRDEPETAETVALALDAHTWLLQYGWRLGLSLEEAAAVYDEGCALAKRHRATTVRALLAASYAVMQSLLGGGDTLSLCEEAAGLVARTSDRGLQRAVYVCLGMSYFTAGRLREGRRAADRALADSKQPVGLGTEYLGFSPWVCAYSERALFNMYEGRLGDARDDFADGIALAARHGASDVQVWMHASAAELARFMGIPGLAEQHATSARTIANRGHNRYVEHAAFRGVGFAHLATGNGKGAANAFQAAVRLTRDHGVARNWLPKVLGGLARALVEVGDGTAALAAAQESVTLAHTLRNPLFEADALLVLGRTLLYARGAAARTEVEEALNRADRLIGQTGAKLLEPLSHLVRGGLALCLDDGPLWRREVDVAHRLFEAMGAPGRAAALRVA